MDSTQNMKQDLSLMLDSELKQQLTPGESVVISLPGSFGEAFVVTDKRVIVIRDCEGGANAKCDVHTYPLSKVKGAEAASSGMGGNIELKLPEPPETQDAARVYFPSYDLQKFQAAAEYVEQLASAQAANAAAPSSTASIALPADAPGSTVECPNCGATVAEDSVFCRHCGNQLKLRCAACGSASPAGSAFCEACGSRFEEFPTDCRKCGARVQRWQSYCVECGAMVQQSCAACGSPVVDSWKHCANCGRQLGGGALDARSNFARRMQERAREQQAPGATSVWGSAPRVEPVAEARAEEAAPAGAAQEDIRSTSASGAADMHNQRGQQAFEDGDVEAAVAEFQSAVNLDPDNASYHCNLAIAYDENGQDDEALAEYETTLRLDPNDLTALLSLGYLYNENEQPEKAEEYWGRVLEIAPDSAEAQEVRENLSHQEEL